MTIDIRGDGYHLQLEYKGVFDLNKIAIVVREWLETRGYEFHEDQYKLKKGLTKGKILEMYWNGYRNYNEFIRYWIFTYVMITDAEEIEVVEEGKKKKALKGSLFMRFDRGLTFDYRGTFEKSSFKKGLEKFLVNYVYKKKLDSLWEDKLRFKMYDLQTHIKEILGMSTRGSESTDMW